LKERRGGGALYFAFMVAVVAVNSALKSYFNGADVCGRATLFCRWYLLGADASTFDFNVW